MCLQLEIEYRREDFKSNFAIGARIPAGIPPISLSKLLEMLTIPAPTAKAEYGIEG